MEIVKDILVLPFFGQGHLFPFVELCKHLSSHNCKPIFIIPSHLSSPISSDLYHHPSIEVVEIQASSSSPPPPDAADGDRSGPGAKPGGPGHNHHQLGQGIESFITERYENARIRPAFVVMDAMMSWSKEIFKKADIPIVSFFTSGACATAMEYAAWNAHVENIESTETRLIPGLPESMGLAYSDAIRRDRRGKEHGGSRGIGPPKLGEPMRWMDETEGSTALLINTCDDLEAPFLEYLSSQVEKPVFGVGPLLPETFWKSIGSVVHDRDSRPNRASNYTEDEVIQWLDSKPRGSVIYVSFGSVVGPTMEEYDELADALVESNQSFIWVIQPGAGRPGSPPFMLTGRANPDSKGEGYEPHGIEEKVGKRGLIIKGWAPQLLILSHPSTGGFLSHCGWNSTVEAIGCGVPIFGWPIRGDQFCNAKLVVKHLKVGHMVPNVEDVWRMVKKLDIMQGIKALMDDEDVRGRGVFEAGYPSSSAESIKELIEFMSK